MRLSYLIFMVVISVVVVTECKPLSDDVGKAPRVDCKQKTLRRKRSYKFVFTQADQDITLDLGCLSCYEGTISYIMTYNVNGMAPVNGSPDIYIGNGQNNENHVIVNGANNVYIGNGDHNTNYVTYNA